MIAFAGFSFSNMTWANRFAWSGVVQQYERGCNGAQHIESTLVDVGRPITFVGEVEPAGPILNVIEHSRTTLGPFTLTINGVNYQVKWHHNPVAVNATPLKNYSDADPDHFEKVELHFITV
ncbi:hypothetical protein [Pseudoalteromonas ruthenica]|uniref:hypothetical protein n=1 Tax=Pseudoalteromonas ruthenica TaxID=151081 RepID=UPI00110A85F6|nr:hypothetical protein [Pseudoalteromonas ruthenica]TMP23781.1 hypothetical protein CWC06_09515 [Pseudoalteromonas ruthenica]